MPASEQCQQLPLLSSEADMGEMAISDVTVSGLYAECAARNAGWIRWATEAKQAMK